jgi:DNA-binding NarL/FixJ family response regulator
MRLVIAVHSREVKTALFLALNGIDSITIVATATSTAELVSYWRAFRPDVAIVENGLPGRSLGEAFSQLDDAKWGGRILIIDPDSTIDLELDLSEGEAFGDVEHLVASLPATDESDR